MNQQLEDHLAARRQEADNLKKQVGILKQGLAESNKRLSDMSLKLAAVDAKTEAARKEARKIAAELNLKQRDIESRQKDLLALEQRIDNLKKQKNDKKGTVVQLNQVQRDLKQTKEEIQSLKDYLNMDLLIRAENALAYD